MLSLLDLSLAAVGLVAGLTGAWSPCGFSMVETVGLAGEPGRRLSTVAACATFAPGAVLGGVVTFGLMAGLGRAVHGDGGSLPYLVAAAIALAAAVGEARGARIVPQIRRQLPEGWRWTMPLPVAAALYGVLLGLGFTTFVLTFGVWALAGICVALGDPAAGVAVGAAFGIGRAIPVIAVAPFVDRPRGIKCIELMAERPASYRMFRLGDAAALVFAAVVLMAAASASAARTEVSRGADPSAAGGALAYQRADRAGVLRVHGQTHGLPGRDPAVGGPFVAVIPGADRIEILSRRTRRRLVAVPASHVQAVAVSRGWLAYLAVDGDRYLLRARRIGDPSHPGKVRGIASATSPTVIGRPSLAGGTVFYALSKPHANSIKRRNLKSGRGGTVAHSRTAALLNPSAQGRRLLYVRVSRGWEPPLAIHPRRLRQSLMIRRLGRRGSAHRIYSRGHGRTLWTTSLTAGRAYVTLLRRRGPKIISTHP